MKSKIFSSAIIAPLALVAGISLTACGDDKNPSSAPAESSSSIAAEQPTSSESGSTQTDPSAAIPGCAAGQVPTPVNFVQDDFVDIGEVYKGIQCNEKVIFIVRHAEREPRTNSFSALTEDGFDAAKAAGARMSGTEPFHYVFSGMVRTYQTAAGIAAGRGEITCTTDYGETEDDLEHFIANCPGFSPDTLKELKDGWFLKDNELLNKYAAEDSAFIKESSGNKNIMIASWVYEGKYTDAFYDLEERSLELISLFDTDYSTMPKYTLAASHDQALMPIVAWATNKQIDMKLHEKTSRKWLNYLAGVAIIINDKNEKRYVAIKGMDVGA